MNNEILLERLQDLIIQVQNNTLSDEKQRSLFNFLIELDLKSQLENNKSYSQGELVKFLSLGWYIYTNLLND